MAEAPDVSDEPHEHVKKADMSMQDDRDTADVIAPPPLLAAAAIVLGLAFDWLLPAYIYPVSFDR
jgi:hypothetical protein